MLIIMNIYKEGAALLAAKKSLALAEIIEHQGSTPREKGALMLVWNHGGDHEERTIGNGIAIAGTIGGGRLEGEVADKAAKAAGAVEAAQSAGALDGARAEQWTGCLHSFELSGNDAADMDMICGGSGTVMISLLDSRDQQTLDMAAQAVDKRQRAWLVTLLEGNTSYTAFVNEAKDLICGRELTEKQKKLILDGAGPAMHTEHLEGITVYARSLSSGPLLYIFGAGHVGLETAKVAHQIGFETSVIDDRPEFANPQRFPDACCIVAETAGDLPALHWDDQVYVLIMTRGHLLDYQWLLWILSLPVMPKYVGMIGSRRKTSMIYDRLAKDGIDGERIRQVYSPVGLAIGAQTPAEIAVSISAQLIQIRNA